MKKVEQITTDGKRKKKVILQDMLFPPTLSAMNMLNNMAKATLESAFVMVEFFRDFFKNKANFRLFTHHKKYFFS